MRTILLDATINGFKSIDKPITIQFTNKYFDKEIVDQPQIKAIYGTNGEGKSAIIHAIDVYLKTILIKDYLTVESASGTLFEIINKKTKKASVSLRYYVAPFAANQKEFVYNVYEHTIKYSIDESKKVFIEYEELKTNGTFLPVNGNNKVLFTVKNGSLSLNDNYFNNFVELITDKTKNLLNKASLLHYLLLEESIYEKVGNNDKESYTELFVKSLFASYFALNTRVFLDEKDSHSIRIDKIKRIIKENNITLSQPLTNDDKDIIVDNEIDEIYEKDLSDYKKEVNRICNFLKIFKPELKKIEVDESPIGNNKLRCKKILIYKDGTPISSEYESSGIKKLMKLYPVLAVLENGGIAFIDEFDSNIHDVYLCKIIEYAINYTKGQLIFTTHNLGPMEVLDKSGVKHSIDFINNSKVSSWKRNGNYSVVKVYRGGAIPNCPFNIDAADFVKVFGDKKG